MQDAQVTKILMTRTFKEIITLIICFACFYNFCEAFKQLARAAFVQNVQFSHIFKRDKLCLERIPGFVSIVLLT